MPIYHVVHVAMCPAVQNLSEQNMSVSIYPKLILAVQTAKLCLPSAGWGSSTFYIQGNNKIGDKKYSSKIYQLSIVFFKSTLLIK
jgi:hypothetical protein